jgi:hypothetical protein
VFEVRPTANLDDIKAVLSHPVIWDAITDDNSPSVEDFDFSFPGWLNIAGYEGGKPFALMQFHEHYDGSKLHIQVLPEHRDKAREFADQALIFSHPPLYAEVPEIYPNVLRFAESFGFEKFITYHKRHLKNGSLCDVALLRRG